MLELRRITKHFPGTTALDDVSVSFVPGRIHALLGENGAGKTTLVRIAAGAERPDAGEIRIDGRAAQLQRPGDAIRRGVGMVHQHFTAIPRLTVAENVALGGRGLFSVERVAREVHRIAEMTGLTLDAHVPASELPITALARLEIVKALGRGARFLLLDEPTALLAPAETAELLAALRRIADGGTAVVLITHKLREALDASDEITVLRSGRHVLHAVTHATSAGALAAAMFGEDANPTDARRPPGESRAEAPRTAERILARAEGLCVRDEAGVERVRNAGFVLYAGEIVGVAGIEGSGFRELLRAVAGRLPAAAGHLDVPDDVAFVPEDREGEALLPRRPLFENVALRGASMRRGLMPWRSIVTRTVALIREHDVRASGPAVAAGALSGGNQQKLVVARELDDDPRVVVAENPTRGLDAQATRAVHARLRSARDGGAVVLFHSTDIDELLELADRVLVTHRGGVRAVAADRLTIGAEMIGAR